MATDDPLLACRTLAHFLAQPGHAPDEEARDLMVRDLLWKARTLDANDRAAVFAQAFAGVVSPAMREEFADALTVPKAEAFVPHRDVAIVTVIDTERRAVLFAFGRDPDSPPDRKIPVVECWDCTLSLPDGQLLTVVVAMISLPRNVRCALAVSSMDQYYRLGAVLMVGISAGVRGKVKLGDVIMPDRVRDYEEARLEKRIIIPRLLFVRVHSPRPMEINLHSLMTGPRERMPENKFQARFQELRERVETVQLPADYNRDILPEIHDGTIVAGDKLIADGSLLTMKERYDQRIVGGDMEDSGFAQAAEAKDIPWCIIRGVSDFADPHKSNGWQYIASVAAATAAHTFLLHCWASSRPAARTHG